MPRSGENKPVWRADASNHGGGVGVVLLPPPLLLRLRLLPRLHATHYSLTGQGCIHTRLAWGNRPGNAKTTTTTTLHYTTPPHPSIHPSMSLWSSPCPTDIRVSRANMHIRMPPTFFGTHPVYLWAHRTHVSPDSIQLPPPSPRAPAMSPKTVANFQRVANGTPSPEACPSLVVVKVPDTYVPLHCTCRECVRVCGCLRSECKRRLCSPGGLTFLQPMAWWLQQIVFGATGSMNQHLATTGPLTGPFWQRSLDIRACRGHSKQFLQFQPTQLYPLVDSKSRRKTPNHVGPDTRRGLHTKGGIHGPERRMQACGESEPLAGMSGITSAWGGESGSRLTDECT